MVLFLLLLMYYWPVVYRSFCFLSSWAWLVGVEEAKYRTATLGSISEGNWSASGVSRC